MIVLVMGMRPDGLPFFRADTPYSDSVTAHWPNALFLRQSVLLEHTFPVWRETTMGGQPFAANPLNKTAYPFQWLALLLPPSLHLNVLILLHLFIAGSGMWMWARSLGLRTESVVLTTIAFTFAPRLLGYLGAGHLDVVYAFAWCPWLMWSVRELIRRPSGIDVILQTALIAALLFLADVRVSLFAFVVAVIYLLFELWRERTWRRLSRFMISGSLFALLVVSLVVPLLMWQPYLSRSDLTPADAGVLSLELLHLLGLVLAARPPAVETLTYVGLPVFILAAFSACVVSGRKRWLVGFVGVMVALYAMGPNSFFWPLLLKFLPGLSWFRVPTRAWLILSLWMPLLAGYGLDWLLNAIDNIRSRHSVFQPERIRLVIVVCMVIVVICALFALVVLPLPPSVGLMALLGGGGVGILLLVALSGRITARLFAGLIIFLMVVDLGVTAYAWVEWRGPDRWLNPQRALAERLLEVRPARIYSPTYSLEQQVAEVYGLRLFGGVDPFQLKGLVAAIEQGSGVIGRGYSVVQPPIEGIQDNDLALANRNAAINTEILAQWDVSHIVAAYPISNDGLQFLDAVDDVYIYTNLDYFGEEDANTIPDWPSDWPDLPDSDTVNWFNQVTFVAWLISSISFAVFSGLLLVIKLRVYRG